MNLKKEHNLFTHEIHNSLTIILKIDKPVLKPIKAKKCNHNVVQNSLKRKWHQKKQRAGEVI